MIKTSEGFLLLEILLVIGILAAIVSLGSQLFMVSSKSNQSTEEKNVAQGLAEEELEAVRSVAMENWLKIYQPPDGSGDPGGSKGVANFYHPVQMATGWDLASGPESISLNGKTYNRYFTIENISRDAVSRHIDQLYYPANDDPSTQKITAYVYSPDGSPISISEFITRWKNKICVQNDWSGGVTSATSTCSTNMISAVDPNLVVSSGTIKLVGNIPFGEERILTNDDYSRADTLIAQQATLAQEGTLQSLSMFVYHSPGRAYLGVYDSSGPGGSPGNRVAETAEFSVLSGWNTQPVLTPVFLPAGTYYLTYVVDHNSMHLVHADDGLNYYIDYTYGPMPSTFPSGASSTAGHWSFYGTVAP